MAHSCAKSEYFACVRKLHFRIILCGSEKWLHLWLRLCAASSTNEIIFVGDSPASDSFTCIVRILCLCQKTTLSHNSEKWLHLWLRLCKASPRNEIIFVGNSSAVCELFMCIDRTLCLCKKTTRSHNSARLREITIFMVASVTSLTHKWKNYFSYGRYYICGCNIACQWLCNIKPTIYSVWLPVHKQMSEIKLSNYVYLLNTTIKEQT